MNTKIIGFALSVVIVTIVFVVAAVSGGLFADFIGVWKKPVIGGGAAFFVVITGYVTAPSHKQIAAAVWLIVGAIAAWVLAGNSSYPEDYTQAFQPTIMPLIITYLSGLVALLLCVLWDRKRNKTL